MIYDDEGTGRPVVFVHGFPVDRRLWSEQRSLSTRVRMVRFDLAGFGDASVPPDPPDMGTYAESVRRVMDRAGLEQAVLCGLSMGGYVLFEFWRRYPQRVSALVLCDTRAEADTPEGRASRQSSIQLIRDGRRQEVLDAYLPKLLAPGSLARESLMGHVRAMVRRVSDEGLIAALQAMHDRADSVPTLATIRVPTLILVGAKDTLTPPSMAAAMQGGIPESRLVEIPESGHLTPLENPPAFNAALAEFLS